MKLTQAFRLSVMAVWSRTGIGGHLNKDKASGYKR